MPKKQRARKPIVMFCDLRRASDEIINISSQNGAEGVVTQMLPKSHISHVILNANVSEERFLDMKVSTENRMQKKSMDVHDHFINTFIKRLERKQERWMKEDNYVSKNLQTVASPRRPISYDFSDGYPVSTPQSVALYRPAKYPYSAVTKRTKLFHHDPKNERSRTAMNGSTLPQISPSKTGFHQVGREPQSAVVPNEKIKLPKPPTENNNMVGRRVEAGYRVQEDNEEKPQAWGNNWQPPRSHATQRSHRKKVGFKVKDDRFLGLMHYLSPVLDKNSLRGGHDVFLRLDSAMSKSSSRLVAL